MVDEPRQSMFRQWSEAQKAQRLKNLECPTCKWKDLPNRKPLLDLIEDGTAYCNKCGGTWRPE
jgi:hypothetical protein